MRLMGLVNRVMGKHLPPEQPTGRVCAQQWISVEERLPWERRLVLTFRDGYQDVGFFRMSPSGPIFATHSGSNCGKVTHWMPLPSPPLPPSLERLTNEGAQQ